MRDGEPNMYAGIATLRNGQTQLQWGRMQMLVVFNTIAIPLVLGTQQDSVVKFAICSIGFIGHFAMFVSGVRGNRWIKFFDSKLAEFEKLHAEKDSASRVQIFSSPEFAEIRNNAGVTSRKVFTLLGVILGLLWASATIWQAGVLMATHKLY